MTVLQPTAAPLSGVQRLLLSEVARALASGVMRAITCCERGRLRIDPHLRGHVTPGTLARLASGFRVVRIGAAAYLRRGSERWIVGVWDGKGRPGMGQQAGSAPSLADRARQSDAPRGSARGDVVAGARVKRALAATGVAFLFAALAYLSGAVPWTMAAIFGVAIGLIVFAGDRK